MRKKRAAMRIRHLFRYPFKSMRGEELESARFDRGGIAFDRRFALRDETSGSTRRGKQATARQHPAMLGYSALVSGDAVVVVTPDGSRFQATDPALVARLATETRLDLALREDESGANHDDADVLIVNAASIAALGTEWNRDVNPRRFRPNVVVAGDEPFQEEGWVGRYLLMGEAALQVVSQCERCFITTVDPETLAVDPSFLRLVAQSHRARFGVYARVVRPGAVSVRDACTIAAADVLVDFEKV